MVKREASIFMHFRPDEHPFVQRALDFVDRSVNRSMPIQTHFLNPREQYILETLIRRKPDVNWMMSGGYSSAERCRAIVSPSHIPIDPDWFELSFLRIERIGHGKLNHPDVLGALLGLGIKREMLGDLHPHENGCDCIIGTEMIDYICSLLHQVGRTTVNVKEINAEELLVTEPEFVSRAVTVSSLRLDAILAEGHRLSRAKATLLIKNGKCKVNFSQVDNPSFQIGKGDMISLSGYGRICMKNIEGLTKKGRYIILLDYLI
ncbi:RNA-binding protein [Thermoflavimicrobium daqui]|jgi:RNA-binding protein YlmH|uniref:RNA-binding protein n=1 Tax=Thermoflavimicrobium daqui TaxID=2137476 RepID=A0A364K6X3_9BACL|nr:YlmH/Sll1252 family protein [Thermoflavimicrobium daqui]RAL26028.1 RNA-binding protein [Thermoflavimicrobium daqui]